MVRLELVCVISSGNAHYSKAEHERILYPEAYCVQGSVLHVNALESFVILGTIRHLRRCGE